MTISAKLLSVIALLLWAYLADVQAQQAPAEGYPFTVNYTRGVDYFGSLQTWGITRDENGILLFGNSNFGVQQFDGTVWRNIDMPANAQATSFAKDDKAGCMPAASALSGVSAGTMPAIIPLNPSPSCFRMRYRISSRSIISRPPGSMSIFIFR